MNYSLPDIGPLTASVLIITFLWLWTLKRPKAYLFYQEVELRRQNRQASMSFSVCLLVQVLASQPATIFNRIMIGSFSFLSLLTFVWLSTPRQSALVKHSRMQIAAIIGILLIYGLGTFYLNTLFLIPVISCFLIATICQKRFVDLLSETLRDIEALQTKLSKKEAERHNRSLLSNP